MSKWDDFKHAFGQWWISFDQLLGCTLAMFFPAAWGGTWADETLSCRAYRTWRDGKPWGRLLLPVIDSVFKWQKQPAGVQGHCHGAYLKERARYNLPPEMR